MDEFFNAPWHQDPNLQARFRELRGRIEGHQGGIIDDRCRICPKSESDKHVPAFDDIIHVSDSFQETGYVCLNSGCKSSHKNEGPRKKDSMENSYSSDDIMLSLREKENSEDKKEEATNKINLKTDTVTVKPEGKNQDVTDITDQGAIKTEFPTPEDITHKCHHCKAEFKEKTSFISHMKNIHNAENSISEED